jgi:hypothetical protein
LAPEAHGILNPRLLAYCSFPSVHATVPPVLDGVVAPIAQPSCNLSPPFAHLFNQLFNHLSFTRIDWFVVQIGFEVLVVAFSTLLR